MDIQKDGSILISKFEEGIGQSELDRFSDMLGINISDSPGSAFVNNKFNILQGQKTSVTFTANASTDVLSTSSTYYHRGYGMGIAFTVSSTGTLPGGLTAGTVYYASAQSAFSLKVCTSLKNIATGTYVDITSAGTGTHTMNLIFPKKITDYTSNPTGQYFFLDYDEDNTQTTSAQRVWYAGNNPFSDNWLLLNGNTSFGSGNGIIFYKGYILVFGNAGIDALANIQFPILSSSTITWTNDFLLDNISFDSNGAKPFLSINDDSIYFNNGAVSGRYYKVGLFEEAVDKTFNPGTSNTFTLVNDVFTIPFEKDGFATSIKELREYLVVATGSDKVYFWDKKSPAFTFYNQLREKYVASIETIGSYIFAIMKNSGNIYQMDTISETPILKFPLSLTDSTRVNSYGTNMVTVYDSAIYERELLWCATIMDYDVNNTAYTFLFSLNIDTGKFIKRAISSNGATLAASNVSGISRIMPITTLGVSGIIISNTNYDSDIDEFVYSVEGTLYRPSVTQGQATLYTYDNYESHIITGVFQLGEENNKKTTRRLRVGLKKKLLTGEGLKIYYRRDIESEWTLLKTIDYTTYGAFSEKDFDAPITDIVELQIKIELKGNNPAVGGSPLVGTSPYLKYIKLI